MPSRIQLRRDTAANWTAANPVLGLAEPGLETDTNLIKYGDGTTAWNSLPYAGSNVPEIAGNLIPSADGVYTLGSASRKWSDLYLTGNSIYLGNIVLRDDNGNFKVESDGATIDLSAALVDRGADSNNWDNLTQMGLYTVDRTSWSGVTGAPLDCLIFVGVLEVLRTTDGDNTSITQCFMPGEQQADVTVEFTRSYWNGVWTQWIKNLNDNQILVGGSF
jgi:hypothetical protein